MTKEENELEQVVIGSLSEKYSEFFSKKNFEKYKNLPKSEKNKDSGKPIVLHLNKMPETIIGE